MPEYLIKIVHDSVLQDLVNGNQRTIKDEMPDLNENSRGQR
jgi:hypothetical protein